MADSSTPAHWHELSAPRTEVNLHFTLPTGQTFRWQKTAADEYTGLIGDRAIQLRHAAASVQWRVLARSHNAPPEGDSAAVRDFLNLDSLNLTEQSARWAAQDARYREVAPYIFGARVLRQPPVECLFEFICSSNNHLSRIAGMVEHLCRTYGTKLDPAVTAATTGDGESAAGAGPFYAFPTVEQLQRATEPDLRAHGFGYRARYIVETARALAARPEGGESWLLSLRPLPYPEATAQLTQLSGVGPKVAACIALFACDQHAAIPVDTHVWKLACKYYLPSVRGKTLTAKLHPQVMQAFVDVFGEYAGWAHNALFISELASHKHLLHGSEAARDPPDSRAGPLASASPASKRSHSGTVHALEGAVAAEGTQAKMDALAGRQSSAEASEAMPSEDGAATAAQQRSGRQRRARKRMSVESEGSEEQGTGSRVRQARHTSPGKTEAVASKGRTRTSLESAATAHTHL